jgi:hypothetical protein
MSRAVRLAVARYRIGVSSTSLSPGLASIRNYLFDIEETWDSSLTLMEPCTNRDLVTFNTVTNEQFQFIDLEIDGGEFRKPQKTRRWGYEWPRWWNCHVNVVDTVAFVA